MKNYEINEIIELEGDEELELDGVEPTEENRVTNIAKLIALGIGTGVATFGIIKRNTVKRWLSNKRDARLARQGYVRVEVIDPENETESESFVDEEKPEKK